MEVVFDISSKLICTIRSIKKPGILLYDCFEVIFIAAKYHCKKCMKLIFSNCFNMNVQFLGCRNSTSQPSFEYILKF